MSSFHTNPLHTIMHPRRVAVVGASNSMVNMGTAILNNILCFEFKGKFHPASGKSGIPAV